MRLLLCFTAAAAIFVSGCTGSQMSLDSIGIPRPSNEVTASVDEPATPRLRTTAAPTQQSSLYASMAATEAPLRTTELREPLMSEMQPQPLEAVAAEPAADTEPAPQALAMMPVAPMPEPKPAVEQPSAEPDIFAEEPPAPRMRGTIHSPKFRDAKPVKFSSGESPRPFEVHGVDVSRWQGNINWPKLKTQGANFAFIKATDGGDHTDPMFRRNWKGAKEAGIARGAYHFFYWCRNAESQAKWFIRNVPKEAGALPPVIDVEWNGESRCRKRPSRERVLEKMTVFMDMLERHYGQRPIIYTAPDFYRDNLKGAFPNHSFWLRAVADHPSDVYPGREWAFWQYSGTGLSKGVAGRIDLNVFNGTRESWLRWVGAKAL